MERCSVASAGKTRFGMDLSARSSLSMAARSPTSPTWERRGQWCRTQTRPPSWPRGPCSGEFSTGVDQYGNALCNVPLTIQLQQYSAGCSTIPGVPGYGIMCFDPTSGLMTDIDDGGWTQFVHSNLFN